jgi:hypothetical protein
MRVLIAALVLGTPLPLRAQVLYDATYSVQQNGKDIGTEHVVLRSGQASGGVAGTRLELEGRFSGSTEVMRGVITRTSTGAIEQLQLDSKGATGTESVRAVQKGGRFFITMSNQGARGGREVPGGPLVVMLDQQLQSLFLLAADLATPAGTQLTALYPRTGQKATFTAKRVDAGARGATVELAGDVIGRISLDAGGHVDHMDLPQAGIVVTKLPS